MSGLCVVKFFLLCTKSVCKIFFRNSCFFGKVGIHLLYLLCVTFSFVFKSSDFALLCLYNVCLLLNLLLLLCDFLLKLRNLRSKFFNFFFAHCLCLCLKYHFLCLFGAVSLFFGKGIFFFVLFLQHFSECGVSGNRHHKMLKFHSKIYIFLVLVSHLTVVLFAYEFKALLFVCIKEVPQLYCLFKVRVFLEQVSLCERWFYLRFFCNLFHKRSCKTLVKSLTNSADTVKI